MSHTSTSSSEAARPERFRPETQVEIPAVGWSWWRWLMPLVLILAAEFGVRVAMDLRLIERPSLYGHSHIDRKVEAFEDWFLPLEEPGRRFLIMGSSMPNTNIDPVRLRKSLEEATGEPWSGFNAAFCAGRYDDMNFFLDWYYERWPFEHLVMTFEPWGMRPGKFDNLQTRLSAPPLERWLDRHSALFAIRNQMQPWDHNRDPIVRGIVALDLETTIHGWVRTIITEMDRVAVCRYAADAMFDQRYDPPRKMELDWEGVYRARAWAAERGITVWWTIQATAPTLEPMMDPEYQYPSWRQLAEQRLLEPGNYLIDMKDMEGTVFADDDFFDANHYTPRAAIIHSVELGRRWGALWLREVEAGRLAR